MKTILTLFCVVCIPIPSVCQVVPPREVWSRDKLLHLSPGPGLFEPVNEPHSGDLLKADSHTLSTPAPAARADILSNTIQRLVLFQGSHSALLPPPFDTALLLGEVLPGLAQPGLSKAIRANYRYPVTSALGQAGEGRRGQAGEQGSAWDKKTGPPWAPLYQSVSLAPQTGRPGSMNGSLDGTSETLSHHCNFSPFLLQPLPIDSLCFSCLSAHVGMLLPG